MGFSTLHRQKQHGTNPASIIPLLFFLLPAMFSGVAAADDCVINVDGVKFDFGPLRGPSSVTVSTKTPPTVKDMIWTVDPCGPLKWSEEISNSTCPKGTHICGVEWVHATEPKLDVIDRIIPISGDFDNNKIDPKYTRLSNADSGDSKDGVKAELHGGMYGEKKQSAVIEFICDQSKTGMEGQDAKKDGLEKADAEKSLQYVGYDDEVLKLSWRTKQACEKQTGGDDGKGDTEGDSHWGFFTWFIIILFMVTAAYLIFGSWLNYNRYGYRGWDLLPHGDTLRDIPYLIKDFVRKIAQTLQGGSFGGGRAGYSAV